MPLWLWAKSMCFRNYCKEIKLFPAQYSRNTRVQLTQWLITSKEKWKPIEKGTIHSTIAPNDRYTISLIQKPRSFWTMANILPFGQIPDIPFIVRVIHRNARDGEEGGREGSGQAAKRRETLSICRLCIPLHSLAFTRYWFSVAREWAEGRGRKESKYNRGCLWSFCGVFALCLLLSALSLSPSWSSSPNPLISCAFPHPAQVHLLAITTDSDPHRFQFALRHSSSTHTTNHYEEYGLLSQERGPTSPWVNYNSIMQFFLCWCVFSSIHSLAALRL